MKTFGELTAEVLRFGFDDGPQVNKARIEDWINEGQRVIANEVSAPEFQEKEELTLVPGKYVYTPAATLLKIEAVVLPEQGYKLVPADLQKFETLDKTVEGTPSWYTFWGTEIWLWPTPSTAEKLVIRYVKRPPVMTAEANTPVLEETYLYLLVRYALIRAYEAEDDYEASGKHSERYARELKSYASGRDRIEDRPMQLDGTWGGVF